MQGIWAVIVGTMDWQYQLETKMVGSFLKQQLSLKDCINLGTQQQLALEFLHVGLGTAESQLKNSNVEIDLLGHRISIKTI